MKKIKCLLTILALMGITFTVSKVQAQELSDVEKLAFAIQNSAALSSQPSTAGGGGTNVTVSFTATLSGKHFTVFLVPISDDQAVDEVFDIQGVPGHDNHNNYTITRP